jgi:hypothetical protein
VVVRPPGDVGQRLAAEQPLDGTPRDRRQPGRGNPGDEPMPPRPPRVDRRDQAGQEEDKNGKEGGPRLASNF